MSWRSLARADGAGGAGAAGGRAGGHAERNRAIAIATGRASGAPAHGEMRRLVDMRILSIVVALAALAVQPAGRDVHLTLHEGTSMAASMSPDGRTIAIDLLGTIWMLPAAGGRAKAVTDIAMDARQPSWSPDGRKIAFQAYRTSTWQIWTMNADGSELRAVTDDAGDAREPAWSPDGKRIAFSSDRISRSGYDIWTIDVASGALTQVTSAPSNEDTPVWRSDADIAFRSDRTGAPGFYPRSLARPSEAHVLPRAG